MSRIRLFWVGIKGVGAGIDRMSASPDDRNCPNRGCLASSQDRSSISGCGGLFHNRESMACMALRTSRISQLVIAGMVAFGIVFIEVSTYGPNIDGRAPSLADMVQVIGLEAAIILAFVLSAVALFRWHKFGWWLSIVLDGLLGLAAASMLIGDFDSRYMATEAGRDAFRGDLTIHGSIMLLSVGGIGFLLLARKEFLLSKPH